MIHATLVCLVLSVLCLSPRTLHFASGMHEVTNVRVLRGDDDRQCPSMEEREKVWKEIHQLTDLVTANFRMYLCGGTSGWRRVAFINMTDTSYSCPTGLSLTSYSKRTCGRSHTNRGCSSTTFSVGGLPYSSVCGRISGYQFGMTSAFWSSRFQHQGIDGYYVDGVSLTHGGAGERQHIWTFAAGLAEGGITYPDDRCPCDTSYSSVPSFVGNSYFCESGLNSDWVDRQLIFYTSDILWDGQNCTASSTCCELNNPPWFTKYLPDATTDDIELRICTEIASVYEDISLEIIELYVQ